MPLFDRAQARENLRTLGIGRTESRSLPPAENQYPLAPAFTGSPVNTFNALLIADVWAAVRVLSDAASSLPLHIYRKGAADRERVDSGFLNDLLESPSPGVTQADLVSTLMAHLAVWGNGYLAKYRQGGEIVQIGLLDPDRVRPELISGELRFRYSPGIGPQQILSTRDLVHIKGLTTDGLVGLSAVSQAARVLNLSDELVKHAIAFFQSSTTRPSGILKLHPDDSSDARSRVLERLRAESKPHGLLVMEGDFSFEDIPYRMDDNQFTEQRKLAAQEVARVFRIPPHMLGAPSADSMTYSNVEQESIEFVRYSLTPWLRRVELAISGDTDLTSQRQFVRFELDGLLRADAKTRSEVYAKALDPVVGWMSREEVRRLEDLPPEDATTTSSVEQMIATATNGNPSPQEVASNGN